MLHWVLCAFVSLLLLHSSLTWKGTSPCSISLSPPYHLVSLTIILSILQVSNWGSQTSVSDTQLVSDWVWGINRSCPSLANLTAGQTGVTSCPTVPFETLWEVKNGGASWQIKGAGVSPEAQSPHQSPVFNTWALSPLYPPEKPERRGTERREQPLFKSKTKT